LYLDPARVESDVAAALRETWHAEAAPAEVLAAGTLLPGLSRAAGPRFQEWLGGLRGRLAAQHRRASLRQVRLALPEDRQGLALREGEISSRPLGRATA
jgi:hypothetical protein